MDEGLLYNEQVHDLSKLPGIARVVKGSLWLRWERQQMHTEFCWGNSWKEGT